jgi:hypothetical protein
MGKYYLDPSAYGELQNTVIFFNTVDDVVDTYSDYLKQNGFDETEIEQMKKYIKTSGNYSMNNLSTAVDNVMQLSKEGKIDLTEGLSLEDYKYYYKDDDRNI